MDVRVKAQDHTTTLSCQPGVTLYQALTTAGFTVPAPCGGRGSCGKCKVRLTGNQPPLNEKEKRHLTQSELEGGVRLACTIHLEETLELDVEILDQSGAQILQDGATEGLMLSPKVRTIELSPDAPSLTDPRSDLQRVEDAFGTPLTFPLSTLKRLPEVLRNGNIFLTAFENQVLCLSNEKAPAYGVAVDIGTTTVVTYLMDLASGAQLDVCARLNDQRSHGADVISRTDHTIQDENGLSRLQKLIADQLEDMIVTMLQRNNLSPAHVHQVMCVGNTVMMHLLAGLTVAHIAVSPFVPVYTKTFHVSAQELGMAFENALITLAPCVAGYVGADTIAAIIASGMHEKESVSLLLDIGTNGEMALGNKNRMLACSTAAGPAFEGAHIRYGMGGLTGAINKVWADENGLGYTTIGDAPAVGICGSGLVDAISVLKDTEMIDLMGRIQSEGELEDRLATVDDKPALRLTKKGEDEVLIVQKDLREIQLAKGAIAAGIEILMRTMDVSFKDIDSVYLAGGFGNYIDVKSACNIGLIPMELLDKIRPIGNGAGAGAKRMLLDAQAALAGDALRGCIEYLELSNEEDFQDLFVDHMLFE